MSIKNIFIVSAIISCVIPFAVHAQIKITEIMYNPEGTDSKREWIEVFNSGAEAIDLNAYFLFENNVYHKLIAQSDSVIRSGEYAIIADSPIDVLNDYTGFAGKIFDSAFSLNNTGESISITNSLKETLDTITYSTDMGANGDGNSLQFNDGQAIHALPTFGTVNASENYTPIDDSDSDSDNSSNTNSSSSSGSTHSQQQNISSYTPSTPFKLGIGRKRIVSINTPIEFRADISNKDIRPRVEWNFGDFTIDRGKKVKHTYIREGSYQIVAEAKNEGTSSIARTEVVVTVPDLDIVQQDSSIAITNKSSKEINIGGFMFDFDKGKSYKIPQNTIIKGKTTIVKDINPGQIIQGFVYPNGEIYKSFDTI